ncbi:DUF4265 domain-containing protein [Anaeromyxobacter oryzae]|uniref:DUF4265 domain-containing protein n=1 Tax=Anaeromyxobacter oryzae TaxID=2918170 RepID=A0ABM7WQL2_9BACT|nr:DUF4265 domain-containing protein [Anaeromyxobacter oryzae]BDG01749.1 hypothetical protein AMOR_07450 [Anaeromyxobacter oryzae]
MTTELAVEGLVRIRVPLDRPADEAGPADDWLWAEPLGSGRYRVESSPFFAYGISRDDVVRAADATGQEAPLLEDVVEKGGHRTLRLALDPAVELSSTEIQGLLERLLGLGCTHEMLRPKIVALDIPPPVDVGAVAGQLQALARDGLLVWEWADPRPS